uniref:UAS domain-containing protein n=1 Tax=Ciona savignyi TaxID=51511 RepID=H2Y5G2_CIOSA
MAETEDTEHLSEELTAKLLHFQEITHTEDLEECKKILIEHNWDIEKAVQAKFNPPIMHDNNQHQYVAPHSPSMVHHRIPHSLIHHHDLPPRQLVYTNYQSNNSSYLGAVFSLLISPFQFSFSTIFGLIKFIWRLFYPDPRERITDPRGDVVSFITEFEEKYPNHPEMFRGTYGDVQSDAKTNLRFLLVYLHDPNNVDSEPFCAGTLCNNNVIQYINETMLFWACSILKPEGYRVSKLIRNPTYPLVAIVCLYQNQLAVVGRIQGKVTPEELISRLQEIVAIYEPVLVAARADRNALTQNQQIREEQDQAYLISLEQDKQK